MRLSVLELEAARVTHGGHACPTGRLLAHIDALDAELEALKAEVRRLPLTPYTNYLDQHLLIGADEATVSEEDVPLTAGLLRRPSGG